MKMLKYRRKEIIIFLAIALALVLALAGCSSGSKTDDQENSEPQALGAGLFSESDKADYSGYPSMSNYEGESMLYNVDVKRLAELIDAKESFVLYAGFNSCPWCNALLPTLNRVAEEENVMLAYLDTRRKPEWKNNMEIDDYDLFVELFGEWIGEDEEGLKHLYVPMIFAVNKGVVMDGYQGVIPSLGSPDDVMNDEQIAELEELIKEKFSLARG